MKMGNNNGTESHWSWTGGWTEGWAEGWTEALTQRIPQVWFVPSGWRSSENGAPDPAELLDLHTSALLMGQDAGASVTLETAAETAEIGELVLLAGDLSQAIRPAYPSPLFRQELGQALLSTHSQQAAQRRLFSHPLFEQGIVDRSWLERMEINSPWFWQVAAAVPVLIAVAALIWRYTRRPAEHPGNIAA